MNEFREGTYPRAVRGLDMLRIRLGFFIADLDYFLFVTLAVFCVILVPLIHNKIARDERICKSKKRNYIHDRPDDHNKKLN